MRGYQPEPKLSECGFIIAELDFLDSEAPRGCARNRNSSSAHLTIPFPAMAAKVLSLGSRFGARFVLGKQGQLNGNHA